MRKVVSEDMTQSYVRCRLALSSDLPNLLVCDVYAQAHAERVEALKQWVADGHCHVADGAKGLLGFAVCDRSFFGQAFIHLVCVAEAHQGQGIGRILLAHVERQCAALKVFTSTNASNIVAQRLFEKAGFVRSGRIDNLDESDPELVYFKPL